MKKPKATSAADPADDWISVGGPIEWFSIALLVHTESLSLEKISDLLGVAPTDSHRKGEPILRRDGTIQRIPEHSKWEMSVSPDETGERDLCKATRLLLSRLNSDPKAWDEIAAVSHIRLFYGLSMDEPNREFSLDIALIRYLADRSIEAAFDIYTDDFDLAFEAPVPPAGQTTH